MLELPGLPGKSFHLTNGIKLTLDEGFFHLGWGGPLAKERKC